MEKERQGKSWIVEVDGKSWEVGFSGEEVTVNGEGNKLKDLWARKNGNWTIYGVPIEAKRAELYINMEIGRINLVIDGIDCETGKPLDIPETPGWAIHIIDIGLILLIVKGGILGCLIALPGRIAAARAFDDETSSFTEKMIIGLMILACCWAAYLAIAFLIAGVAAGL